MKVLFHLAHPAHYHLFKNIISSLIERNISVIITYNDKDILEDLVLSSEFCDYSLKLKSRKRIDNKFDLILQFVEKSFSLFKILRRERPSLVLGTSIIISLASKPLDIKNIIINEDDFDIIEKTANFGYRFATNVLCPDVCRTGSWDFKCIKYNSYHELSYLHPNHFNPDKNIVEKYFALDKPYFLLRFAKLAAHHDEGIQGINDELAIRIVNRLKKEGNVFITSEREMSPQLNNYRLSINPLDVHHVLAYANLYIGDSQTMAAEAGVLGTPFIRINDFVGRISYLEDIENKFNLGWGIKPSNVENIFSLLSQILSEDNIKSKWEKRKKAMLKEKLDYSKFMTDLILKEIS